jgi:hypothetical protein
MSEQNPPVVTVKQEVESILRLTRQSYADQTLMVDALNPAVVDFHDAVLSVLDDIIDRYLEPEYDVTSEEASSFQVGAKYRLTGEEWQYCYGVNVGDVVTITEVDSDGDGVFENPEGGINFLMSPGSGYGGVLFEAAPDSEIRVGDTVRITQAYADAIVWVGSNKVGTEFEVTKVIESTHSNGGTFYVGGDPEHRGIWNVYIEKVHA